MPIKRYLVGLFTVSLAVTFGWERCSLTGDYLMTDADAASSHTTTDHQEPTIHCVYLASLLSTSLPFFFFSSGFSYFSALSFSLTPSPAFPPVLYTPPSAAPGFYFFHRVIPSPPPTFEIEIKYKYNKVSKTQHTMRFWLFFFSRILRRQETFSLTEILSSKRIWISRTKHWRHRLPMFIGNLALLFPVIDWCHFIR